MLEATLLRLRFEQGLVVIDPRARTVTVDGCAQDLRPMAFNVLLTLGQRAGQIVSHEDLGRGAWRQERVDEAALRAQLAAVRRALGSKAVKTVPRQGYQLAATLEPDANEHSRLADDPPLRRLPERIATPLIGRDADLARLIGLCRGDPEQRRSGEQRVVVLGPVGVGKTALVLEAAHALSPMFPDGTVYADLAAARSPVEVAGEVARALGLPLGDRTDHARVLAGRIQQRRMLLILDTCEYAVAPAAALISQLHDLCSGLTIIAVSQQVLALRNPALHRLQPLRPADAEALFLARLVEPGGEAPADLSAVRAIVGRIDAVPLVLERIAHQAKTFTLRVVQDGLAKPFEMLSSTQHDAIPESTPERHRGLEEMLAWSYGLLTSGEQAAFRRLSVLAGAIAPEAAIAVLQAFEPGMSEWQLLPLLRRLADASLMISSGIGGETTHRMLDCGREFGLDRLVERNEFDQASAAHAAYFTARFKQAEIEFETMPDDAWRAAYRADLENLRVARDWLLGLPTRAELAVAFFSAAAPLWLRVGLGAEVRDAVDTVVQFTPYDIPVRDRARMLRVAGMLWRPMNRSRALLLTQQAADLFRQVDDSMGLGMTLASVGEDQNYFGRFEVARSALSEARGILAPSQSLKSKFRAINEYGICCLHTGDPETANKYFGEARSCARQLGDIVREAIALLNLGEVEFRLGAIDHAISLAGQATALLKTTDQRSILAWPLLNSAGYNLVLGNLESARVSASEALPLIKATGGYWLRICLQIWALIATMDGHFYEAAQVFGFISADYARTGEDRQILMLEIDDRIKTRLQSSLSPAEIARATRQGERWQASDAAEFIERWTAR